MCAAKNIVNMHSGDASALRNLLHAFAVITKVIDPNLHCFYEFVHKAHCTGLFTQYKIELIIESDIKRVFAERAWRRVFS